MFDSNLKLAKVTKVHPSGSSIDVTMYEDGSPVSNVQVLSPVAASDCGMSYLPTPTTPPDGEAGILDAPGGRNMIAVIAFIMGAPIAIGFLFPQVSEPLFDEAGRMVWRHESGVYVTVKADGDTEISHPSGAFIKLGGAAAHEDLTGADYDGKWGIPATAAGSIHVEQAGGLASISIDSSGNVTIAGASLTLDGNVAVTGDLEAATVKETVTNVDLATHVHSGVTTGTGTSGTPVPGV